LLAALLGLAELLLLTGLLALAQLSLLGLTELSLACLASLTLTLTLLGEELAGLGVARALLGHLAHPLAELGGVALVGRPLAGAAALLARPAGFVTGRFLLCGDEPLLLLGLLAHLGLLALTELSLALLSHLTLLAGLLPVLARLGLLADLPLLTSLSTVLTLLWLLPHLPLLAGLLTVLSLLGLALLGLLTHLPLLALALLGEELAGLGVTRALLGHLSHLSAELGGVALVGRPLVGAAALLARPAGFVTGRFLLCGDEPLLLLGLLCSLLAELALLCALLAILALLSLTLLLVSLVAHR